jgi:hypothetical protein
MSDRIDVIVTIEPAVLEFETACKALGNVRKGKLGQRLHPASSTATSPANAVFCGCRERAGPIEWCGSWEPQNA